MSAPADAMRRTAPKITIDGALLSDQVTNDLLEMRIVRGTRATGRATLTFADRTFSLARSELKIGAEIKIASLEPAATVFIGTITAVSMDLDEGGARATLTAHDHSYAMARKRAVETYTTQSPKDIVDALVKGTKLTAELPSGKGTRPVDWAWRADSALGKLDELCERAGWEWVVSGTTLRILDVSGLTVPEPTCTLDFDVDLVRFSAEESRGVKPQVTVRGWDTAAKAAVTATSSTPSETKGFTAASSRSPDEAPAVVTRGGVTSQEEAKELAAALAVSGAAVTARGRAVFAPKVEPGSAVTIKGTGPGDGHYYVREVEHVFDGGPLRTSFVAGFRPPTLVSDPWASQRLAGSALAGGVHTGLVSNVEDPLKLGRVRVSLASVADKLDLDWARVVALGGGPGRGIQWLPEVGDEVLVTFEDGDPRRPVVIGGLHSKSVPPPYTEAGKTALKRMMTSRGGHALEFGDGDDEAGKYIDLMLKDGKVRLHLGADRIDLETSDKPLRIASGGAEIVLDGKGGITIKGQKVTIEGTQEVAVKGAGIKAKANQGIEMEGMTATVKAQGSLKLQSSGMAELAGSMVKIN